MHNLVEMGEYFSDIHVWPIEPRINVAGWLKNFTPDELPYAQDLLRAFFLFNEKMCKNMLKTSLQKISLFADLDPTLTKQEAWQQLLENAIFATVNIEDSNITASGHLLCRWVRQFINIPEEKFLAHSDALTYLDQHPNSTVIFIDDFVGSGLQFTDTWTTPHGKLSFPMLCQTKGIQAFYVPILATEYGLGEIRKTCTHVSIIPGNILDARYGALHSESIVWTEGRHSSAASFIEAASKRAGIPNRFYGFHDLALTVAFQHSIPDATLPLFNWKGNGWKPLMELS